MQYIHIIIILYRIIRRLPIKAYIYYKQLIISNTSKLDACGGARGGSAADAEDLQQARRIYGRGGYTAAEARARYTAARICSRRIKQARGGSAATAAAAHAGRLDAWTPGRLDACGGAETMQRPQRRGGYTALYDTIIIIMIL